MFDVIRVNDAVYALIVWIIGDQLVPKDKLRIIPLATDVIALGNKIKIAGPKFMFPFKAHKALVVGNAPGSERYRLREAAAQEVMEGQARTKLGLPGEEMIPSQSEGEPAEVRGRQLVHRRDIQALHKPLAPVAGRRVDEDHVVEGITLYRRI